MHFVPAVLAHKHQPSVRPIRLAGMTTASTSLTGVVCVHLHGHRPVQRCFVSQKGLQFSKAPLTPATFVGAGFFRSSGVRTPLSTFTDIRQLFQPDEGIGEATKNTKAQLVVPVSDKPSFSPADFRQTAGSGTSAFTLQVSKQAGKVVFPLAGLLTALEKRVIAGISGDSVITLAYVHPNNALMVFGLRVWQRDRQSNQKVILLLALLVVQLCCPDFATLSDVLKVLGIAVVSHDLPPFQRLHTDLLPLLPREISSEVVGQGAAHELARLIQPLITTLGVPLFTGGLVLAELCPLNLVASRYLTGRIARHLGRKTKAQNLHLNR